MAAQNPRIGVSGLSFAPRHPTRGATVAIHLPDGGGVPTTVCDIRRDGAITLALPPVVRAGSRLRLSWAAPPAAYSGSAVVLDPGADGCLAIALDDASIVERRRGRRSTPRRPLVARATHAGAPLHGAIKDVSRTGLAFWTESGLDVGSALELTITLADGDPVAGGLRARVARTASDGHGPRTIGVAFDDPDSAAGAIDRL